MTNDQTNTEYGDFSVAIALFRHWNFAIGQQHWGFYPNDRFA